MKRLRSVLCAAVWMVFCMAANAQEAQSYFLHTIEKGQSLYSISTMYGVSKDDIIKLNPGSEEKIYVGRTLKIPQKQAAGTTQEEAKFHTIVAGETLYRLSQQYHVSTSAICEANPGLSAENFKAGQVIRIPKAEQAEPVPAVQQQETTVQVQPQVESKCREMHKIKKGETIFSISQMYGVTEADLIAANPELDGKTKIKKGKFLCIPHPRKAATEVVQQEQVPVTPPTNEQVFNENKKQTKAFGTIKVAVVLPLVDGETSKADANRMLEYYEGFLLAVDSIKRQNGSVDIYTYDSGKTAASVSKILTRAEMKDMDVIFGPLYTEQIKPLSDFCKEHKCRLVIPFTSKDNAVYDNPYIYQVNTPQSYLYSEVYEHFVRLFTKAHVIFLQATTGVKEKADFVKGLTDELNKNNIPITTLSDKATSVEMKAALKPDKENIFVPTSGDNLTLIKVLPQLSVVVREDSVSTVKLFGYPEWQTYTKDHLSTFFELDTYFYTSFYTNNLLPAAQSFTTNYQHWYRKEMEERYPKYGMLGFDTGYFFLSGMKRYGSALEENVQKLNLKPVQTGFKFQRVNNWGGFINKKVFFVHYTKDFKLIKLDFD